MISNQILQTTLDGLKAITRIDWVYAIQRERCLHPHLRMRKIPRSSILVFGLPSKTAR